MKSANEGTASSPAKVTTKTLGDLAEAYALQHLQAQGLRLLQRNYRTPGRGGGEIDLIMQERDGTLVFVEVRRRSTAAFGGAAASVGAHKQRRIVLAAKHYLNGWLRRHGALPPCRFDVLAVQTLPHSKNPNSKAPNAAKEPPPMQVEWLRAAFDAA
jgi:putative endonuclease